MSKKIILTIAIAVLLISVPAMADPPSTTNVTWGASGNVNIAVVSGNDFTSVFNTGGGWASGAYTLTDAGDNPYSYGVDTVTAQVQANVTGGGFLEFNNTRTDSWVPMYGSAGENSYTYITTDDTAQLQFRTRGNYADLQSSNYGFQANDHFQATGTFSVYHSLNDNTGEGAMLLNTGTGSTDIDFMSESTWGKTGSFKFGKGCGCYTNADITATGSGVFQISAIAENQIDVDMLPFAILGDGTLGSAQYNLGITYGSGLIISNFALSGN